MTRPRGLLGRLLRGGADGAPGAGSRTGVGTGEQPLTQGTPGGEEEGVEQHREWGTVNGAP